MVANGLLHFVVAWLALRIAFGGAARADQAGALEEVASQPFGHLLLWLITGGFAAVTMWRLHEAVRGHRHRNGRDRTRKRLFAAGQAVVYASLTVLAVRVAAGAGGGSGGTGPTALLLREPFGRAVVIVIGIGVGVTGVVMIVQGWRMAFCEDMDLQRAAPRLRAVIERCGQVGSITKGIAVGLIGALIVVAGTTRQPEHAEGLDVALRTVAGQPFGVAALCAIAIGLVGYGVFAFFDAVFHRI